MSQPDTDFTPRRATWVEKQGILQAIAKRDNCSIDELAGNSYTAIFDHYITDGLDYSGPVALVLWGGDPGNVTSLHWDYADCHWVIANEIGV